MTYPDQWWRQVVMRALVISKETLLGNITFRHDDKLAYRVRVMLIGQTESETARFLLRDASIQRRLESDVFGYVMGEKLEVLSCTIFTQRQLISALRHVVSSDFFQFVVTSRNRSFSLGSFSGGIMSFKWSIIPSVVWTTEKLSLFNTPHVITHDMYAKAIHARVLESERDQRDLLTCTHIRMIRTIPSMKDDDTIMSTDLWGPRLWNIHNSWKLQFKGNLVTLKNCKESEGHGLIHFLIYPCHFDLLFHFFCFSALFALFSKQVKSQTRLR